MHTIATYLNSGCPDHILHMNETTLRILIQTLETAHPPDERFQSISTIIYLLKMADAKQVNH